MYLDAVVIYGQPRSFGVSIEINENADIFKPFDLSPYSVKFKVLGSSTADAEILIEHLITQNSNRNTDGIINDPTNGEFVFTITAEDTKTLGLGQHPIQIDIIDAASGILMHSLTEGAENGEFSKINIVQV